jgi:hypothetical protein
MLLGMRHHQKSLGLGKTTKAQIKLITCKKQLERKTYTLPQPWGNLTTENTDWDHSHEGKHVKRWEGYNTMTSPDK